MRRSTVWRQFFVSASLLASASLALPAPLAAATLRTPKIKPQVITGAVSHARGNTAQLEGVVNPRGLETTYFFQYGPTIAYGSQTPAASAGSGSANVKVGQSASPFRPGYHYRLVASNAQSNSTKFGHDRTYTTSPNGRPKVLLTKPTEPAVFGSPIVLTGTVTGPGAANHRVSLQSSPFPYLEAFTGVGLPTLTNAFGRFTFRVPSLTTSTQFRVVTLDILPMYSPQVTEHVAVRVTFKVRSAGRQGFVRLYGTVSPAQVGARVSFQLQKAVRPGRTEKTEETTTRFVTQFSTVAKRATRTTSRFSSIVSIQHTGRYRAFVRVRAGANVSGNSQSVLIHAAPAPARKAHRKKH
ncbi:MAG: hypothetical protein ACHP93_01445 [Solirubrobacterales bacterium]